jgi:hypothetical protein
MVSKQGNLQTLKKQKLLNEQNNGLVLEKFFLVRSRVKFRVNPVL